jgi:Ca-activated chloride channel family protein
MKKITIFWLVFLMTTTITAQRKKITGTVTDQDGLPLPGVNISIEKTNIVSMTDFDGNYKIQGAEGQVLLFKYFGQKDVSLVIGKSNIINVQMQEDAEALEEVVVTAYSIKREKRVLGYAVTSVGSSSSSRARKRKAKHAEITSILSGKATGVNISGATGASGSAANVVIRGMSSIKGNKEPLYIVDGVPILKSNNSVIAKLNPNEIDKIKIYKDKKAKHLYGNSASNGCVVISTKRGNYQIENDENYAQITENKFEKVELSPLSTFSIDVDKASYSNIRRLLNNGQSIPVDAVKIEEMVNYFDYKYPQPTDEHPFSINTEVAKTPWNADTKLVRIGLQGKEYLNEEQPASNLTFLIDVSGSMNSPNKLPLLKSAFKLLVNQLRKKDKVSIVVYAGAAGVVLEPTSGDKKEKILQALDNLSAGGSTAGGAGIKLAYKLAEENFKNNGNNRVILATDGDFNVGASSDSDMQTLIEEKRESGVFLSAIGFGMGNYKDSKLETLADKGNGNHSYIDTMQEAQKVFGNEFGGTLYTIAKDVKIQVEFNPAQVKAFRLIGYENRLLADEDFIDDTKDAGELGSGHKVTAIYEVIPRGVNSSFLKDVADLKYTSAQKAEEYRNELLTVKFRYKKPSESKSIEMIHVLHDAEQDMSQDFSFASAVALFGMQLRKSAYTNNTKRDKVLELAELGRGNDDNGYRAEFIRLVKTLESNL